MPEWTQTNKEVVFLLPLPEGARAKDVKCKITNKNVELSILGNVMLKGDFFVTTGVRADDSVWELEDAPGGGRQIRVTLVKTKANQNWDCCFMDEIDETITHTVFMDISIGGVKMGRVKYGLFGNAYPKTVENFRCLCTGEKGAVKLVKSKKAPPLRLHYKGHDFFRVVPGFVCQGGDITRHPDHFGGRSIYGPKFDDEGFKIKHKGAGDLLMANFGFANNNHSQFAVAMNKLTEFETKHVIFGRVVEGMDLFRVMELEGSGEGDTRKRIVITDCGELDASGAQINVLEEAASTGVGGGGDASASASGAAGGGVGGATADGAADDEDEDLDGIDDDDDEGPVIEEVGDDDDDDGPVLEEIGEPRLLGGGEEEVTAKAKAMAVADAEEDGPTLELQ